MTRRIAFALLLALAAAAYFLLRAAPQQPTPRSTGASDTRSEPHADIDDASRAALDKILEDADKHERPRR